MSSIVTPTTVIHYPSHSHVLGVADSTVPTSATASTASPALAARVMASSPAAITRSCFHRLSPEEIADK
jgi:hypothetical protein